MSLGPFSMASALSVREEQSAGGGIQPVRLCGREDAGKYRQVAGGQRARARKMRSGLDRRRQHIALAQHRCAGPRATWSQTHADRQRRTRQPHVAPEHRAGRGRPRSRATHQPAPDSAGASTQRGRGIPNTLRFHRTTCGHGRADRPNHRLKCVTSSRASAATSCSRVNGAGVASSVVPVARLDGVTTAPTPAERRHRRR